MRETRLGHQTQPDIKQSNTHPVERGEWGSGQVEFEARQQNIAVTCCWSTAVTIDFTKLHCLSLLGKDCLFSSVVVQLWEMMRPLTGGWVGYVTGQGKSGQWLRRLRLVWWTPDCSWDITVKPRKSTRQYSENYFVLFQTQEREEKQKNLATHVEHVHTQWGGIRWNKSETLTTCHPDPDKSGTTDYMYTSAAWHTAIIMYNRAEHTEWHSIRKKICSWTVTEIKRSSSRSTTQQ